MSTRYEAATPLPSFGAECRSIWNDRLSTRISAQYFGLSFNEGEYSGDFIDALAAVEYRLTQHLGLGGGYHYFDLQVDRHKGNFTLSGDYSFQGLLAYLFVRF